MAEIVTFKPRAASDADENLRDFIRLCRTQLTIFGEELDFDSDGWDVTAELKLRGHGKKRIRAYFSRVANDGPDRVLMAEPMASFSRAYFRYMHGLRPKKAISVRLNALRALDQAMIEGGRTISIAELDSAVFNRAGQLLAESQGEAAAYQAGQQLEVLADFLDDSSLVVRPLQWINFIKRPIGFDRIGPEFDERRRKKLPSKAGMDAIPKVFRLAKEPADVVFAGAAAIMCSAPDRVSEVLCLAENCETPGLSSSDGEPYGLRWWPGKGAMPMVKYIIPTMVDVVREAIQRIRQISEPARRISKWYEERPDELYLEPELEYHREKKWLTPDQVGSILGVADGRTWCKLNVPLERHNGTLHVKFKDVERKIIGMLPEEFPILDPKTGLKYSEALFVVRRNELGAKRSTFKCLVEPVTMNQVNTALGARTEFGFQSIFSRFGFFEDDGSDIRINTHRFRHSLNTMAQEGGMSQLDIAKWSGRLDVRQNETYDHMTSDQLLALVRASVGNPQSMIGLYAELPVNLPVSRDEFGVLRYPTAHTTDLGLCVHDFTMSPCPIHRDCLNCQDLVCVKGDRRATERLKQRLAEANLFLAKAQGAAAEGYVGGDRWMEHHKATIGRLTEIVCLMEDSTIADGTCIQIGSSSRSVGVKGRVALPT